MRNLLLALASLLTISCFSAEALAQAYPYNLVDCSVSSLSGSSQALVAKNPQRKYLMIFDSGANPVYVNLAGGTASSSGVSSIPVAVGGSVVISGDYIDTTAATVIGTSGQPVTCFEGR